MKPSSSLVPMEAEIFPEQVQILWRSVILTAFQDAQSQSTKQRERINKQRAIFWLVHDKADFFEVCQNAGCDPKHIRRKAQQLIPSNGDTYGK